MIIKKCFGYELEKEKRNTSEDLFNRSEVTFLQSGKEQTLHILYLRYFDEIISDITPFEENPLISIGEKQYEFNDIVALVCLLNNKDFQKRKRVYINDLDQFKSYFENINVDRLYNILRKIESDGSCQISDKYKIVN